MSIGAWAGDRAANTKAQKNSRRNLTWFDFISSVEKSFRGIWAILSFYASMLSKTERKQNFG